MDRIKDNMAAEKIRASYLPQEQTKLEKLRKLDKQVKLPATMFAYIFGIVGALVLGTGMCLAMKVIGNIVWLGVVVGLIGIAMVSANYLIYKAILNSRKKKYGNQIIQLSDEILNK